MPTLIIDGKEIDVKPGTTIMEAARLLGIYIPHFCYHPRLPISGNCRMCLVEVEKMPKPVISCAMPVSDGMVVKTGSEMVQKARQGVLEFLLINHPLDCPVCDQGGECTLQDLAMKYGPDRSRFHDHKRQVPNHDLGHLIEAEMNRCIHCTRCIRFSEDVSGVEEMGAVYRGDHMRVGPFKDLHLGSELTGNLAQLCPVGALNNKPFHFLARGWELKKTEGVCGHCSVGCHTRMDHKDGAILRVMARRWAEGNETWICDKGRFACDGLQVERLEAPMLRVPPQNGALRKTGWAEALDRAAEILKGVKPEEVAGLASVAGQGAEELYAFQDFLRNVVGTPHLDHRLRQRDFSADAEPLTRADLLMNTALIDLPKADVILLVGSDPRFETPLLNFRLRRATQAGARVFTIQPRQLRANLLNLTEMVVRPGEEPRILAALLGVLQGESAGDVRITAMGEALKGAKRPVVLLGDHAINHPQAEALRRLSVAILERLGALGGEWNGFNRVSSRGNAAAAQDFGVVPHRGPGYARLENTGMNAAQILAAAAEGRIKVLVLLGCDPLEESLDRELARRALEKALVIHLGAFASEVAKGAAVVLPGLTPGEKSMTLTNCEGRAQVSGRAVTGPLEAKEDWRILRALSDRFAAPLGYNDLAALRKTMAGKDHRYDLSKLAAGESPRACDHSPVTLGLPLPQATAEDAAHAGILLVLEPSFHQDDPVARRSKVLGKLAREGRVRIHPGDAAGLRVAQDGLVRLLQGDKKVELRVDLDERVPRGVVFGHYGHGTDAPQELCDFHGGFPRVSLVALPG
ncbi:MAG: NADH-quinone oxidoreductase subunit NuoG [Magnetococcales bacterium]|nr:NADH-quinone oxidoreductase subunit NuoG [Magnetococcales bacterium]